MTYIHEKTDTGYIIVKACTGNNHVATITPVFDRLLVEMASGYNGRKVCKKMIEAERYIRRQTYSRITRTTTVIKDAGYAG